MGTFIGSNSAGLKSAARVKAGADVFSTALNWAANSSLAAQNFSYQKQLMDKQFNIDVDKFNIVKQQYESNGLPYLPGTQLNMQSSDYAGNNYSQRNHTTSNIKFNGGAVQRHFGIGSFW